MLGRESADRVVVLAHAGKRSGDARAVSEHGGESLRHRGLDEQILPARTQKAYSGHLRWLRVAGPWRGENGPANRGDERSPVHHSMTWSARSSTDCGIVRPSAFAVLRLMTSSNLVGCSTGRSAGLAPLRILST